MMATSHPITAAPPSEQAVLLLHRELADWQALGIRYEIGKDDHVTFTMETRAVVYRSEADSYRRRHHDEIRRYLAFVRDRDPEDALRHLEYARRERRRWVDGELSAGHRG